MSDSLAGQLLIASPGMRDPRFEHSVILMVSHGPEGAMGLITNRDLPQLSFSELMARLDVEAVDDLPDIPVRFGGPVEPARGFVLLDTAYDNTVEVAPGLWMGATKDTLGDLALGKVAGQAAFFLGHAGWAPGQIEAELAANGWLTGKAAADVILTRSGALSWAQTLQDQGIDPALLSMAAGHA